MTVSSSDLLHAVEAVEAILPQSGGDDIDRRVRSDLIGIRALVMQASGVPMELMTRRASIEVHEARRQVVRGSATSMRFENSVWVHNVVGARATGER